MYEKVMYSLFFLPFYFVTTLKCLSIFLLLSSCLLQLSFHQPSSFHSAPSQLVQNYVVRLLYCYCKFNTAILRDFIDLPINFAPILKSSLLRINFYCPFRVYFLYLITILQQPHYFRSYSSSFRMEYRALTIFAMNQK